MKIIYITILVAHMVAQVIARGGRAGGSAGAIKASQSSGIAKARLDGDQYAILRLGSLRYE